MAAETADRLAAREALEAARATELDRRERDADRRARKEAREHLLAARRTVEQALAAAQGAVNEERAREARRVLEDEIRARGAELAADEDAPLAPAGSDGAGIAVGDHVVTASGIRGLLFQVLGAKCGPQGSGLT